MRSDFSGRLGSSGWRGAAAFTLVELLVVIGIIAVLISLLLPTLNSARSAANDIACRSNLRQIAQAIFQYATDNRGCYPIASSNPTDGGATGSGVRATWSNFFLARYLGNNPYTEPAAGPWQTAMGYHDPTCCRCPVDDQGPQDMTANNYWGNSSYLMCDRFAPVRLGGVTDQTNGQLWTGGILIASGHRVRYHDLAQEYNGTQGDMGGHYVDQGLGKTTRGIDIYPRGENPLIIEGTGSIQWTIGQPAIYARVGHGNRGTKMNYISIDLSIMQVDLTGSPYRNHLKVANDGLLWGSTDPNFEWMKPVGSYATPWSPQNPTQALAIPGNFPNGGAYLKDFPYGKVTAVSGPLFRCGVSSQY